MFCGECGTKNKKGSEFCSNCGSKLESLENNDDLTETKIVTPKPKKPMSKKNKIILCAVVAVVLILGIGYKIGSDKFSPRTIANDYIKAVVNNNYDKLYSYLEIKGDTTFITKKAFKEKFKEKKDSNIENFKIIDVTYSDSKLSAKVKFSYTTKNGKEDSSYIYLAKEDSKKFLVFDSWKISKESSSIVNIATDVKVKTLKGSKIVYAGCEVSSKYLDKKSSTDKLDVYVLPQVFKYKTLVKATLPNGLEIKDSFTPYDNYTFTLDFDEDNLSKDEQTKILSFFKTTLQNLYDSVIAEKKFDDIKKTYEKSGIDLTKLNESYTKLVTNLQARTRKLNSITFTDGTIYSASFNSDGNLKIKVRQSYNYKVSYTNYNNESKTDDKTDYSYIELILGIDKNGYYLINLSSVPTYFY